MIEKSKQQQKICSQYPQAIWQLMDKRVRFVFVSLVFFFCFSLKKINLDFSHLVTFGRFLSWFSNSTKSTKPPTLEHNVILIIMLILWHLFYYLSYDFFSMWFSFCDGFQIIILFSWMPFCCAVVLIFCFHRRISVFFCTRKRRKLWKIILMNLHIST